jgi:large subunit ribosomal protein L10
MSKFVKDLEIREYRKRFGKAEEVLFVNVVGMEATETNKLRLLLRKKGIDLHVVKNTLAAKVLRESGHAGVEAALNGPSAVVWGGEDIVSLAREITDWAKKIEKLTIKGASVGGQTLDTKGVDALSKLPSRIELLGQIVTMILSPGANIAGALLGPGGTIAGQIKQIAEPDEKSAEAPAEG